MMAGGFSSAGLSVLIVDGDLSCLKNLETILEKYHYKVKTSSSAKEAAEMLKNERFEMVISDVNMSDINNDGFLFIRYVAFNTKIPIILMSNDEETNMVMRGLQCGACGYLHKPIEPKDVQFIWQHVYRKRIYQIEGGKEDSRTTEIGRDGSIAGNKRGGESGGDSSSQIKPKKPRLIWTKELHRKFKKAVEISGPNCPKKILELMGTKSLTREQVASHLQKHRLKLARDAEKEAPANMNLQIQNQVANRINHYQGMQCVQNLQVQCEFNNGYSKFRMPQPARNYTFHAPPVLTSFPAVSEHINPRTTMMSTNNESPVMLQSFQIQNQVANCINHYQGLNRHVQNSSNQHEFGVPPPAQNDGFLLDGGFHAPLRLTSFPTVHEHINPHTTMIRTNNEQNVEFGDVVDPSEPLSTFNNMDEQLNVETNFYHQNLISSLPDAFGYSDQSTSSVATNPNTNTGFPSEQNLHEEFIDELFNMIYSPVLPTTFDGSDPNVDSTHTYPKIDSDS